jgi:glutathione S-transferase
MSGKPVDPAKVAKGRENVKTVVKKLEGYFLKSTPYISSQVITAADIFCACELMQV